MYDINKAKSDPMRLLATNSSQTQTHLHCLVVC